MIHWTHKMFRISHNQVSLDPHPSEHSFHNFWWLKELGLRWGDGSTDNGLFYILQIIESKSYINTTKSTLSLQRGHVSRHKTCLLTRQHGLLLLTNCYLMVYKNNHHKKLTMQKTLIVTLKSGLMSFLLK